MEKSMPYDPDFERAKRYVAMLVVILTGGLIALHISSNNTPHQAPTAIKVIR